MQPRTTAIQKNRKERFNRIVRTDIGKIGKNFQFGNQPLTIPAHSHHTILIDQEKMTTGYPKLTLSGGKGAHVQVKYAEALYDKNNHKGNRNRLKGKKIKGISDVYVMDGGQNRVFQPLWFRSFRFIQLKIKTKDKPLKINDFYNVYASSPITQKAEFTTGNPLYQQIWQICWHTLALAAQGNLLSDLYYEQLQYVGDLRPHLKAWTALTGDLTYFRNALKQFNYSRLPDGNITSCYPLNATFVHPTYSLIWIDMLHDYMMLTGDKKFLQSYMGEMQEVFDYYDSLVNKNGLVGKSDYPMFIDWYQPKGGNSPVNKNGNSAILTLNYVYTLRNAADIVEWLGYNQKASYYRTKADKYAEIVRNLCFDPHKGIYADDPAHTFYDQRATILAILAGAHTQKKKKAMMRKVLSKDTNFDSRANLFYYFYLFEAMEKTQVGNFTNQLAPWEKAINMGLTTTPEKRVGQHPRSDTHPWTAHPVHYYFSFVSGIEPASPGFATVHISPQPGSLNHIKATYPTIRGNIQLELFFDNNGGVKGKIILPEGMTGTFVWEKKKMKLRAGPNNLK